MKDYEIKGSRYNDRKKKLAGVVGDVLKESLNETKTVHDVEVERLKKENIGIVNETLATGIVVDKSVLKKPVIFSNFCQVGSALLPISRLLASSLVSKRREP